MRIGVVGSVAPDLFADNVGDALLRMGMQSPNSARQVHAAGADSFPVSLESAGRPYPV